MATNNISIGQKIKTIRKRKGFTQAALAEAIGRLPPLWRKILYLRFYGELSQQQTADKLGLTQVKISREEKKIVAFLREELTS